MLTFAVTALLVYAAVVGLLYLGQRQLLYLPRTTTPQPADWGAEDMAVARYPTEDGLTLAGWHSPAEPGRATVVYFHGNAGHYGDRALKTRYLREAGYGLLLAGYRGYGGNPGRPTEQGLKADGRAAVAWLQARGVPPHRIVLYGESLGSGVAVPLAAGRSIGAVVLEAPFTSITDVAARLYFFAPVRWLLRDRFESIEIIGQVDAPLLIVHGERDTTVPVDHGRRLLEAATEPKQGIWVAEAGHADLHLHGLADAVLAFLDRHAPSTAAAPQASEGQTPADQP